MKKYALLGLMLLVLMLLLPRGRSVAAATATPTATSTATATATATTVAWQATAMSGQAFEVRYEVNVGDIILFVGQIAIVALVVSLMLIDQAKRSS